MFFLPIQELARRNTSQVYLFFYTSFEEGHGGWVKPIYAEESKSQSGRRAAQTNAKTRITGMRGYATVVGEFRLDISATGSDVGPEFSLTTKSPGPQGLTKLVKDSLRQYQPGVIGLPGSLMGSQNAGDGPDFVAYQVTADYMRTMDYGQHSIHKNCHRLQMCRQKKKSAS